jgi:uncharacterized membrane protein YedE/YeeE
MRILAGTVTGIVFGIVISWSGMASPDVIREALLFEHAYLFLMFASAVGTAALGLAFLRRRERAALLTGERLTYGREPVQRRHIVGSLLFGTGWAVADACPAPIAAQIGQGIPWALFTLTGVGLGVWLFLRRGAVETEPAADAPTTQPRLADAAPGVL